MDKVSTIEIQGVQWAIEDQEATKRIDNLEEKTNIKRTRLWSAPGSYLELVEINGIKFYNAFFQGTPYIDTIGQTIFSIKPVGQVQAANRAIISGDKTNNTGRVPVSVEINSDGTVKAFAMLDNQFFGTHVEIALYGQFFQMVN